MRLETAINKGFLELKKKQIKSALLDSELLLSKAINKKREFIILNSNYNIEEEDYLYFQAIF